MSSDLAFSSLSGRVFVVTAWVKGQEGRVAKTKVDVTDQFVEVAKLRDEWLANSAPQPRHFALEEPQPRPPGRLHG